MKKCQMSNVKCQMFARGFTLVELLIVIAIIGILSGIAAFNIIGSLQKSRDGQRKADLRQIQSALELYRADQGGYPSAVPNCPTQITDICPSPTKVYLNKVPSDPSSGNYTYTPSGSNNTYSLTACLERSSDPDKDSTNVSPCDGSTRFSYTLKNP